jgi:hypothetical protein
MNTISYVCSATVWGYMVVCFMVVIGCAATRAVVEPSGETASPPPVVDPAAGPPTGPPPGHVEPTNYWVREKIILTSEQEPSASATQKRVGSQGKKRTKTGTRVTE